MTLEEYKELYFKVVHMTYDWEGFFGDEIEDKDEYEDCFKKALIVSLMKETIGDVPMGSIKYWFKQKKIDLYKESIKYMDELYED